MTGPSFSTLTPHTTLGVLVSQDDPTKTRVERRVIDKPLGRRIEKSPVNSEKEIERQQGKGQEKR